MEILRVDHGGDNGVSYYGPFPTSERALEYAQAVFAELGNVLVSVEPLIVPNCLQVQVRMIY